MFAGGSDDGAALLSVSAVSLSATNTAFSGGADDGSSLANATAIALSASSPFSGGSDDGSAIISASSLALNAISMFAGGIDDGFNGISGTALPLSATSIYSGGSDDGTSGILASSISLNSISMFAGGTDDGFNQNNSSALSLSATNTMYAGGVEDGFSSTFATATLVALPIQWEDFTAQRKGEDAVLDWIVAYEHPGDKYEVMRSFDGLQFEKISTVNAMESISSSNEYHYTDLAPASHCTGACNAAFYRIRHLAVDGRAGLSNIRRIALDLHPASIQVYPNPANDRLTISFQNPANSIVNISLYDGLGKVIIQQQANTNLNTVLAISKVPSGLYVLRIISAEQNFSFPIIISH